MFENHGQVDAPNQQQIPGEEPARTKRKEAAACAPPCTDIGNDSYSVSAIRNHLIKTETQLN
jgi:hypothetical protein